NLLVSSTGALLLALVSPLLLPLLFGIEFRDAVLPAIILLIAIVILGFNYVLSDGLRGLGYPGTTSIAELAGAMTTVIGLVLFLPLLGIYGAAVVSVLSYAIVALVLYLSFGQYSRRDF
ncbi:polysaccharide biosynthesis C-terminal domain-containing protein, partial [Candidatus Saccharibacteria bacterium]|nr:polysaccharide biosynthesis C-terminal domain-containing protein [Candidatus Saccharibacteria bacterium]